MNECRTCLHWEPPWEEFGEKVGMCNLFSDPECKGGLWASVESEDDDYGPTIYTEPTFGCNKWEAQR